LPNGFSGNSNTASIVLSIDTTAQSGNIYIKGQNVCGFGPQISKYVIVSMIPPPPIITQSGNTLISSSAYGNQWYNTNKSLIPGAVFQNFTPQATGDYYVNVKVGQNSNTSPVFHFILNSITESKKPVVTSLKIFPNPFSKSTTFTYTLKEKQKVNLSIYDITGRIVKQLVSEDQTQCEHALTFDAVNLQAGVYFYRLRVGDEVATGKVILAK
jgi:hypothetical protein